MLASNAKTYLSVGEAGDAAAFLDPVAAHLETRESAGAIMGI